MSLERAFPPTLQKKGHTMGGGSEFWSIFRRDPGAFAQIGTHEELRSCLWEKRLAMDNSVNICSDVAALQGSQVTKPHLRNMFFRLVRLLSINLCAFPIIVIDGEPPEAKNAKRLASCFPDELPSMEAKSVISRNADFLRMSSECATLATLLGCPVIHAKSEAEVACAKLNLHGYCDACVTTDGDALALGVRTLFKKFDLVAPSVEVYSGEDNRDSALGHDAIIACLLLCGSDFHPGVNGVSTVTALRLARAYGSQALAQLQRWGQFELNVPLTTPDGEAILEPVGRKPAHCRLCGHSHAGRSGPCSSEPSACACVWCVHTARWKEWRWLDRLRARCCKTAGFPWPQLSAYFRSALTLPVDEKQVYDRIKWSPPNTSELVDFLQCHLGWPPTYSYAHVMPVVARFHWCGERQSDPGEFRPNEITRKYRHHGVCVFDVQCDTPNTTTGGTVVRVPAELLQRCDATLVSQFLRQQTSNTNAEKTPKKRPRSPEGQGSAGKPRPSRLQQSKLTSFMTTLKPSVSASGSAGASHVVAVRSSTDLTQTGLSRNTAPVASGSKASTQLSGAPQTFVDLTADSD
jgi:hypothetical protein